MIQALAPAAYGLLAATALPVLIHLFARRATQRQPFPALMLLRPHGSGSRAVSRWRDWLALLLRCLACACLALAVTGLMQRQQAATGLQRPLVVVLDASVSMRQRNTHGTAWQEAIAAGEELLRNASPRPVALLIAGGHLERSGTIVSTDASPALALLNTIKPSFTAGNTARAVADATAMLPEGGEIAVITDLANRALAGIDPTGLPAGVQLHIVPVAGGGDNRAITRLSLRPGMASLNQTVELGVQVANHAATPADITVEILTNSAREQRTVHIEARSVARLTSPLRFTTAGDQSVHVALINNEGDALTEDDELDGVIPVRDGIAVTVVGDGDQGPRGALRPIVAALKASGLNYRVISSAQAAHDPLASEVLISAGATAETGFSTMAAAFLDRGGCWLQIIDGPGDIALARAISDNHMPIVLGEEFSAKSREISAFTVVQARLEHPLLSGFFGREVLLGQVEAYRIVLGTPADHSQVLLAFEDGTPALAELAVGRGRWWQLNCSPAEVRSNLAALDLMPLFVERLSAAVIPELAASLSIDCGNAIPAPRGIVHLQRGAVLINDSRALLPWPGLYRDATGGLIAAGIPEAESDLRPVAAGVITALGVRVDENGGDSDHGTPLWPWLLLAGTIALMLESIVARPAPRGPA